MQVWVAGGTYTDYKGFVIRDYVEVLGGFPNEGTPGLEDRYPLIAKGIPLREDVQDLNVEKYETILQIQSSAPVNWEYNNSTHLSTASVNTSVLTTTLGVTRKPVLFQPDVCMTTTGPVSDVARTDYLGMLELHGTVLPFVMVFNTVTMPLVTVVVAFVCTEG